MGLLELIRHESAMRKLFGQQELKIMEKQLLGINLTASEKTRLSRDIRQKLKIISELLDFKKEFFLKKSQEINYLINEATEEILKSKYNSKIKKIILFGSHTEKTARLNSDIDIAILFDKIDKKQSTKFRLELSAKIPEKIDLQVFNTLPEKIKKQIIKTGKTIYNNE